MIANVKLIALAAAKTSGYLLIAAVAIVLLAIGFRALKGLYENGF